LIYILNGIFKGNLNRTETIVCKPRWWRTRYTITSQNRKELMDIIALRCDFPIYKSQECC
jgi:hypothetical protein